LYACCAAGNLFGVSVTIESANKIMSESFSFQPFIEGNEFSLRPLEEADFDELFKCASDKEIWSGHPSADRYKLEVFKPYFENAIASNAFVVVIENGSNNIIGTSKYYRHDAESTDISIGFTFLVRKHWGGKTNLEVKRMMLDYAFKFFDVVWFHVATTNIRSQKATTKIGAQFTHEEELNLAGNVELWRCYKIEKRAWYKE